MKPSEPSTNFFRIHCTMLLLPKQTSLVVGILDWLFLF